MDKMGSEIAALSEALGHEGGAPSEARKAPIDRQIAVERAAFPEKAAPAPPKTSRRRLILAFVLALAGVGSAYEGYSWFTEGRFIVSTDDAYVKADIATLAAKVSGYLDAVYVTDNSSVRKGDLLARIDKGDYVLAVDAARSKIETQSTTIARIGAQADAQKSMIDQAKAQLESAKADAVRADAELQRVIKLVQSTYGTQQRLEQAQADRDKTRAGVQQAEAAVNTAAANLAVLLAQKNEAVQTRDELQVALEKAERDLSFAEIRAPFDGVVGNRAAQPGQYVQPGTRLFALVPLDSVYVEANFKETQLDRLKPGQKVDVYIDAYGSRRFEGTVESFAPASGAQFSLLPPENATGNFTKVVQRLPARIKVPHDLLAENLLRPGLSVVAAVRTRSTPPAGADLAARD